MKKRIAVFILMLVMLVGAFGSVSVYANEPNYAWGVEGDRPNYKIDGEIVGAYVTPSYDFSVFGDDVFTAYVYNRDTPTSGINYVYAPSVSGKVTVPYRSNLITYTGLVGGTATSSRSYSAFEAVATSGEKYNCYMPWSYSDLEVVSVSPYGYDIVVVLGSGDVFNFGDAIERYVLGDENVDVQGDVSFGGEEKEPVYNADLGYLQNIACTTLVKKDNANNDNTANEYAGEKKYKFSYGLTTTSGFDLRSDGADVEYCIKIKGGYTTLLNDYVSLPTVVSDYYKAGHGVSYYYIDADILNELYGQFRTDASLWAKTINSQIYIYMRPVLENDSGAFYGGWSRIKFDKGNIQVDELTIDNGTTPDGEVSSEADGEEDDFVVESTTDGDSSYGEGTDFEDAESNASDVNTNSSNSDLSADEMMQNVENLVSQIGEIPQFISELFSFLPPWCLTLFGVGFGLIVLLIIYKLIRG